jgi:multidrug efflux pump subunit AcrA (membrane-fusion protein)
VSQQIGIPGIVRNGVVVPQSSEPLPEGMHVEIRLEPGDVPAALRAEMEAWEAASDESWKWMDDLESQEK